MPEEMGLCYLICGCWTVRGFTAFDLPKRNPFPVRWIVRWMHLNLGSSPDEKH